ncbi:hypothetical protein AQ490_20035 [Wenjunlia vitaminophila]|uniref:HTH tetR-type domain-containing protein n=1 Tax=Wenjunlia vitaminophila TaxID=76728 RepID=A0A0T6LV78_WENVI|nr:hypothetical protein AQ490_20035 [Wenjunlia vitaminophila]
MGLSDGAGEEELTRTARKRTGRRPGNTESRQLILDAARAKFATHGYEGASIRSIAQEAGVDTALIHHFFTSKDGLFSAAVHDAVHPEQLVAAVVGKRRALRGLGERMVRAIVGLWEGEVSRNQMSSIMRSAVSHEVAAQLLRRFFTEEVALPVARSTGKSDPEVRAALVTSQLVGLAMTRYIVQVHPIDKLPADELVACIAPTIQRYLTGALPVSFRG